MKKIFFKSIILRGGFLLLSFAACKDKAAKFDASGTFEATEIIVSAEATGKILSLDIKEGDAVLIKNDLANRKVSGKDHAGTGYGGGNGSGNTFHE